MARKDGVKPNTYMLNAALQSCTTAEEVCRMREALLYD
jgi:hypothetical protein